MLENHRNREEVQQALKNGSGESARQSATLTQKCYMPRAFG